MLAPVFTIDQTSNIPFVEVIATDSTDALASPFDVIIVAQLGTYATEESDPLILFISDPCE